jgi:hypothetical protein
MNNFADLDSLLAESVGFQETVQAGKEAQRRLLRGNIRQEDHDEAIQAIRDAERLTTWEDVASIVVIEVLNCENCESVTSNLLGYFEMQKHRKERGARRILKAVGLPTNPYRHTVEKYIPGCPHCLKEFPPLPLSIIEDFPLLEQFYKNPEVSNATSQEDD